MKLIAENAGDATLGYQIDDEQIQTLYIANADKTTHQEISIDKGKHGVRFFLIEPRQETFVCKSKIR